MMQGYEHQGELCSQQLFFTNSICEMQMIIFSNLSETEQSSVFSLRMHIPCSVQSMMCDDIFSENVYVFSCFLFYDVAIKRKIYAEREDLDSLSSVKFSKGKTKSWRK